MPDKWEQLGAVYEDKPSDDKWKALGAQYEDEQPAVSAKSAVTPKPAEAPTPPDATEEMPFRTTAELKKTAQPLTDALKSMWTGVKGDVANAQRSQAFKPFIQGATRAGLQPSAPIARPDLSKAPDPTLAGITQAVAPIAIPIEGAATKLAELGSAAAEKYLPEAMGAAKGVVGRALGRGAAGAGYMRTLNGLFGNDDHDKNKNDGLLAGAAMFALPEPITKVFSKDEAGLRPLVQWVKGYFGKTGETPNPEQLSTISQAIQKRDILSTADAKQAPKMQWVYHNILRYLPFTGVMKQQAGAIDNLEKDAMGKLNDWAKGSRRSDYEVREDLQKSIQDKYHNEIKPEGDKKYADLTENADKKGLKFNPTNIVNYAMNKLKTSGHALAPPLSPEIKTALRKFVPLSEKDIASLPDKTVDQIKEQSSKIVENMKTPFSTIDEIRKEYAEYASSAFKKGDDTVATFWGDLKDNLDKDIDESAEKSGVPEISKQAKDVRKYQKENVFPYKGKDSDIRKVLYGTNDFDTHSNYLENSLKKSTNAKVLNDLSDIDKTKLSRLYIYDKTPNDLEKDTASKLVGSYDKLDDAVKNKIITPEVKKDVENIRERREFLNPVYKAANQTIFNHLYKIGKIKYVSAALTGGTLYGLHKLHLLNPLTASLLLVGSPMLAKRMRSAKRIAQLAGRTEEAPALAKGKGLWGKTGALARKGGLAYLLGGQQ